MRCAGCPRLHTPLPIAMLAALSHDDRLRFLRRSAPDHLLQWASDLCNDVAGDRARRGFSALRTALWFGPGRAALAARIFQCPGAARRRNLAVPHLRAGAFS